MRDVKVFVGFAMVSCSSVKQTILNQSIEFPVGEDCMRLKTGSISLMNPPEILLKVWGELTASFRKSHKTWGDCWGYFSCGLKGAIHEFADSQFGHIFAKGPNREAARKSLRFALMNLETWDAWELSLRPARSRFKLGWWWNISFQSLFWRIGSMLKPPTTKQIAYGLYFPHFPCL